MHMDVICQTLSQLAVDAYRQQNDTKKMANYEIGQTEENGKTTYWRRDHVLKVIKMYSHRNGIFFNTYTSCVL